MGQTGRPLLFIWIPKWYIYTRKLTSLMDSDGLLRKLCLSTFFAKWPHCAMVGKYQSNQTKSQNDVFFVTHSLLKIFKRKNTKTWYLTKIIHKNGWGGKNCGALAPNFGAFFAPNFFSKKKTSSKIFDGAFLQISGVAPFVALFGKIVASSDSKLLTTLNLYPADYVYCSFICLFPTDLKYTNLIDFWTKIGAPPPGLPPDQRAPRF